VRSRKERGELDLTDYFYKISDILDLMRELQVVFKL
jgi:hypothetical protein